MIRNRTLLAFGSLAITCLGAVLLLSGNSFPVDSTDFLPQRAKRLANAMDFKTADFSQPSLSQDILDKVSSVTPTRKSVNVDGTLVHVIHAQPKSSTQTNVLLLHGQAFTSATWEDLGTVQTLAAMGLSVAAVDLPGYGKTPPKTELNRALFLEELMTQLSFKPNDTVIVSPSMSGSFSIAFLKDNPTSLKGFVPVAAVGTDLLSNPPHQGCGQRPSQDSITHPVLKKHAPSLLPDLSCYTTPTMVVFGERDSAGFLKGCALLNAMPRATAQMIPNGRHPAYLDNPQLWHTLLRNFIAAL